MLRLKAMYLSRKYWITDIQPSDANYFIEFNEYFRNYLKIILKASLIFAGIITIQALYMIGMIYF